MNRLFCRFEEVINDGLLKYKRMLKEVAEGQEE